MTYNYVWPRGDLRAGLRRAGTCGNTSLQFPDDPINLARRPIPSTVDYNTGPATLNEHVLVHRALRAGSVDAEALHRSAARCASITRRAATARPASARISSCRSSRCQHYCTRRDGVNYKDLTPRCGVDVGRARQRQDGGEVEHAASTSTPPASAASTRTPTRRAAPSNSCAQLERHQRQPPRRLQPDELRAERRVRRVRRSGCQRHRRSSGATRSASTPSGNSVGLATTQCGRTESGDSGARCRRTATVRRVARSTDGAAAAANGRSASASSTRCCRGCPLKFTYNRRNYYNIPVSDQLGIGCDRFNGSLDVDGRASREPAAVHESVVRLLHGHGADRSAAAERRRLHDPRPQHLKTTRCRSAMPTAQTYMDKLNTVERRRHQLQLARTEGHPRPGRHQHQPHAARHLLRDARRARTSAAATGAEYRRAADHATPFQTTIKGSAVVHRAEGGRAREHRVPVAARHRA